MNKTIQREAILNELRSTRNHPTADELYSVLRHKVPQISLGTVYRNLEDMAQRGMIRKLELTGRQKRFDGHTEPHHHLRCKTCGRKLVNDEIALYKRMVNRGATEYLCLTCFAAYYRVTEELLHEKIEHFREMGCTLFH